MGYYKNSFKSSPSSESEELSNLRGWIILAGLALVVLSLFILGNLSVEDGLGGFLTAGLMIFVGTAASFICDRHVMGRIIFLLLTIGALGCLIVLSVHKATLEYFIFLALSCIYFLGALLLLEKYHTSLN